MKRKKEGVPGPMGRLCMEQPLLMIASVCIYMVDSLVLGA